MTSASRWSPEQVAAAAPTPAALAAARPLATTTSWTRTGADERGLWGTCKGSAAEPYDTMVDHLGVGFTCTCPSRRSPCKHALALLLLWVDGAVPDVTAPASVEAWLQRRRPAGSRADRASVPAGDAAEAGDDADDRIPGDSRAGDDAVEALGKGGAGAGAAGPDAGGGVGTDGGGAGASPTSVDADAPAAEPTPRPDEPGEPPSDRGRDERVERMREGLDELDRWLEDRIRLGLSDPALASYGTWDQLAARLVDARAGSLANRIRRLAGLVGASPDWHSEVLAELGILHLLAQAGRHLGSLPGPLADVAATSVGWQVRQADVLAGVPDTDEWVVAGRSDTREDRIEVRRHWLHGTTSGRWALVLSFAAYRQSLDTSLIVGAALSCDLHRYPGPALRALIGERHGDWRLGARPPAVGVGEACRAVGTMIAAEPWLDRVPLTVHASVRPGPHGWVLGDDEGSLPMVRLGNGGARDVDRPMATLLAVSGGRAVDVTCEWTPRGVLPIAIHLDDRSIDIGPRADLSFVGAA
jgi:hypothetical protein